MMKQPREVLYSSAVVVHMFQDVVHAIPLVFGVQQTFIRMNV